MIGTHAHIISAPALKNSTYWILKVLAVFLFICISTHTTTEAQEIDYSKYISNVGVTVSELYPAVNLEFGTIIIGETSKSVSLYDSKVIMIEGIKYLDVILEITADNYLYLNNDISCNGSNSNCIAFDLQAAYANRGANQKDQAVIMQVTSNFSVAQFPILDRGNLPPGPPPIPMTKEFNPSLYMETAYVYLYGNLSIGDIVAGSYYGNINITVIYD